MRAALDTYGVPYTYFADQKLREGNLRAKYDVLIFPHVGGSAVSQVNGMPKTGNTPLPYRKTAETPNLGSEDETDDTLRHGEDAVRQWVVLVVHLHDGGPVSVLGQLQAHDRALEPVRRERRSRGRRARLEREVERLRAGSAGVGHGEGEVDR